MHCVHECGRKRLFECSQQSIRPPQPRTILSAVPLGLLSPMTEVLLGFLAPLLEVPWGLHALPPGMPLGPIIALAEILVDLLISWQEVPSVLPLVEMVILVQSEGPEMTQVKMRTGTLRRQPRRRTHSSTRRLPRSVRMVLARRYTMLMRSGQSRLPRAAVGASQRHNSSPVTTGGVHGRLPRDRE